MDPVDMLVAFTGLGARRDDEAVRSWYGEVR